MTVPAMILAGGASRRFGGGDKTLRLLGGQPILAHVIARLRPQCTALALNANDEPGRFAAFGLRVVADPLPGRPGPLAGVLAGLAWQGGRGKLLTVPADAPFLPADLAVRLAGAGRAIACAASGGRTHWPVALWDAALAPALHHALTVEGLSRVEDFVTRFDHGVVNFDHRPFDPFFNINEPADLERAEAWLGQGSGA